MNALRNSVFGHVAADLPEIHCSCSLGTNYAATSPYHLVVLLIRPGDVAPV